MVQEHYVKIPCPQKDTLFFFFGTGIPDFRTPGTGLYDNLQKYNLPRPQAVFDVAYYRDNPQAFCTLAKELWPGLSHSPTLTHSFLKLLSDKGLLLRNYTQVRRG